MALSKRAAIIVKFTAATHGCKECEKKPCGLSQAAKLHGMCMGCSEMTSVFPSCCDAPVIVNGTPISYWDFIKPSQCSDCLLFNS